MKPITRARIQPLLARQLEINREGGLICLF
jgi:hypothetical protein